MLSVYISGHDRQAANALADALKAAKHNVCSLWHRDPSPTPDLDEVMEWRERAGHNFNFIRACDVHVTLCDGDRHRGGKDRESGFAQGLGKKVAVVGAAENGMQHHGAVKRFAEAEGLLAWLAELKKATEVAPTHIRPTCAKPARLS